MTDFLRDDKFKRLIYKCAKCGEGDILKVTAEEFAAHDYPIAPHPKYGPLHCAKCKSGYGAKGPGLQYVGVEA